MKFKPSPEHRSVPRNVQRLLYFSLTAGTLFVLGALDSLASDREPIVPASPSHHALARINLCSELATKPTAQNLLTTLSSVSGSETISIRELEGRTWIEGQVIRTTLTDQTFVIATAEGEFRTFHISEIDWHAGINRQAQPLRQQQSEERFGRFQTGDLISLQVWGRAQAVEGYLVDILPNGSLKIRNHSNRTFETIKPEFIVEGSIQLMERANARSAGPVLDARVPLLPQPQPGHQRLTYTQNPEISLERFIPETPVHTLWNYVDRFLNKFPYQLAPINTPHDQFYMGIEASHDYGLDARATPNVQDQILMSLHRTIQAFDIGFDKFRIPDQSIEERLAFELSPGQTLETNTTFAGQGGFSIAYFVHRELPEGIQDRITQALANGLPGEAERIRKNWAKRFSDHVIVLADPNPRALHLSTNRTPEVIAQTIFQGVRRRLVLRHLANQLFPYIFNREANRPVVRMNRLMSSDAQHSRGVFIEEVLPELELNEVVNAEYRLSRLDHFRQGRNLDLSELEQMAQDQATLESIDLTRENARLMAERARYVYRFLNPLVIAYCFQNRVNPVGNSLFEATELPSGISHISPDHYQLFQLGRPVGFDFNHATNQFVDPETGVLVTNDL